MDELNAHFSTILFILYLCGRMSTTFIFASNSTPLQMDLKCVILLPLFKEEAKTQVLYVLLA